MPQLGNAKHRIGQRLGSGATTGEGTQNLLCAYLATGVLASLALNTAFGLWWADPAIAFAIALLAIKEGHQTWQGQGCCATPAINANSNTGCDEDCCRSVRHTRPYRPTTGSR
jgi:hypothetical protein